MEQPSVAWKGWRGTILRVDLADGGVRREPLPGALAAHYLGGKGLGTCLQARENPPEVDPLAPENRIILVAGPAAGTPVPTAARLALFARSPLNGLTLESYLGGSFGHFMKKAGYDAIIVEGRSPRPVYLAVRDGRVRIEDASTLWGGEIYATETALKERHGPGAQVLSIGPAGERQVRCACIAHNLHRHFGRMGSGAVMGAKNLKAIVLAGTGAVEVHDPDGLRGYVRELNLRCGLGPADDLLPPRFYAEPNVSERSGGHVVSKEGYLAELARYYARRNWSEEGVPNYRPPLAP